MRIIKSVSQLRKIIKQYKRRGLSIGFVPTMGALHAGHASLLRKARRENDITILSIFVNPMQFGPKEDFRRYPREEKKDILLAKKENIDIIFYPSEEIIYPAGFLTFVEVKKVSQVLCGRSRPGHFRGVTTVVAKLLNIVSPDKLYLGQKDAQQAFILKKMVADLNFDTKVVICPIVRDKDGLALSSRNQYLSPLERKQAPILHKALLAGRMLCQNGEHRSTKIINSVKKIICSQSLADIDYIECLDASTLNPIKEIQGKIMIAVAVRFGKTRLIDNMIFGCR